MLKKVAERGTWLRIGVATVGFAAVTAIAARPSSPPVDAVPEWADAQVVEPSPVVHEVAVTHENAPPAPRPPARLVAVIETSVGTINCTLDAVHAPHTVEVFARLARSQLYDGLIFYRTVPDFLIQAGESADSRIQAPRYHLADEISAAVTFDRRGVLAMANHDKTANGSEFFITDGPLPQLNGTATIFGHCDHPDFVHRIASMPTVGGDYPDFPVQIGPIRVHALR